MEIVNEDLQQLFAINPLAEAQLKAITLDRENRLLKQNQCECTEPVATNSVLDKREINVNAVAQSRNSKKAKVIT